MAAGLAVMLTACGTSEKKTVEGRVRLMKEEGVLFKTGVV